MYETSETLWGIEISLNIKLSFASWSTEIRDFSARVPIPFPLKTYEKDSFSFDSLGNVNLNDDLNAERARERHRAYDNMSQKYLLPSFNMFFP